MSFDIGDVVTLDFTDTVGGVLTDPTGLTLTITQPDSTTVTPSPTHASVGTYSADFVPTMNGQHSYLWTATGTGQATDRGTFKVGGAVSLADVKDHLQKNGSVVTDDAELTRFIDAAETAISHRTGPLTPVAVTERHDGGGTYLVLRRFPAVSLTSASYADGSTLTVTDLDLEPTTAVVYWNYGTDGRFTAGPRGVTITYQAGWAIPPADLVQAVKELVRHLWETQRAGGTSRPQFPGKDIDAVVPGAYSSWPARVQELVAPYSVPKIA